MVGVVFFLQQVERYPLRDSSLRTVAEALSFNRWWRWAQMSVE
ncbi:hypothetical protein R69927_07565 [Paraburkholderia domus]|nr:hypothetical protein R69927_07565 [Paraburkholderia domus]